MLLFAGVGGRLPQYLSDPLVEAVWPLWRGNVVPGWVGEPFTRNAASWLIPKFVAVLPKGERWLQFAPLATAQVAAIGLMCWYLRQRETMTGK